MPKPAVSDDTRLFSTADQAGTAYQFGVSKLPPEAARFSVEEKLTGIREATGRGREGKASSARRFDREGTPAVEYTVTIANDVRLRYFVFLGADYYYVLTVAGTQEAVTSPDAERFFASFRHGP
jgi:hypothetical protein